MIRTVGDEDFAKHRPRTVDELFRILFGDPEILGDHGRLGRMEEAITDLRRLLQWVFVTFLAAFLTLIVDLAVHTHFI